MTFFRAIHFSEVIERYSSSLLDNLFIICGLVNLLSWTDIIITINNRWYNTFISVVRLRWSFYCLGPCVFCRHKVSQTLLRACFRGISGGKILVLSIHSNRMQSSHCSRGTQRSDLIIAITCVEKFWMWPGINIFLPSFRTKINEYIPLLTLSEAKVWNREKILPQIWN